MGKLKTHSHDINQSSWNFVSYGTAGFIGTKCYKRNISLSCSKINLKLQSISRVPSRGGFGGLNPHQNHLDPHFIWPWVQWTLCIDLRQAGSNFSYGVLKSLVCWWPHSSFVLYNVIRKYSICSRIKCQLVTCAQHDPASTPERAGLLLQMKTK